MQHSLCLIKFSNPRPEDPPYPNEAYLHICFAFCSLPQFLLPPHLGLQAFSSLFLSCSAAGHIPFLPHLAPGGKGLESKTKELLPGKL